MTEDQKPDEQAAGEEAIGLNASEGFSDAEDSQASGGVEDPQGLETSAGSPAPGADQLGGSFPPEAVYSPDDPIAKEEGEIPLDAIYFPDDPILVNKAVDGVVTGMAGNSRPDAGGEGDLSWQIQHAARIMNALSKALKEQGLEALKVDPDIEPIDAVLRSFVAGYLIGKTDLR